jgi:glycosyltransferase involved in cell wall biosynthesis
MLTFMKCPWTSLSIFFPVYNEAEALPQLIERSLEVLGTLGLKEYEVIIVDDGSIDGSAAIADECVKKNSHVRAIHHEHNSGYGAALVTGFGAASFEWVAYTDGDGQFDLGDIRKFFEPSSRVDVVLGYRRVRNDHLGRRFNAWLWGRLVRITLGIKVKDLDCGFKLFRTSRVQNLGMLRTRGAVISAELLVRLKKAGCSWEQVEVEHYPRHGGTPTGASLRVIARAMRELVWLRLRLGKLT